MRLIVFGAGGHSREVADLIVACGQEIAGFVDDVVVGEHRPTGLPIASDWTSIDSAFGTVAVGDTLAREAIFTRISESLELPALVHPLACVSPYATIGDGTQIMQNVVVSSTAVIGRNVILNVGCFVAHDCHIGDHSHIAPGVLVSGGASVGSGCLVGAGSVVLPGVQIGAGCTIGAGSVVTHDVLGGACVFGVPAAEHPQGGSR